jgi:hypothetical protein
MPTVQISPMVQPKSIMLTCPHDTESHEARSYSQADEIVRKCAVDASTTGERMKIRVVIVFSDLFVWASSLSVNGEDVIKKDFIQNAMKADWEFNAGVRPSWWPTDHEADRMWGVHYREDRDNGRAELARMRLERYDLKPVVLSELPPRTSFSE